MATARALTTAGRKGSPVSLPGDLFGQEVNLPLLAQVARVYAWHKHPVRGKVKTRAEVALTTAKWFRQKGTGRARHGAQSAPIFVGGGVAHGPQGVRRKLFLNKKQVRVALISALSARNKDKAISIIEVEKIAPKTKAVAGLLGKLGVQDQRILILHSGERAFIKAATNLPNVRLLRADLANAYEILSYPRLVLTAGGLSMLVKKFGKSAKGVSHRPTSLWLGSASGRKGIK